MENDRHGELLVVIGTFVCVATVVVVALSVYEGEVTDGLRHGTGTFICPQRNVKYKGEWVKGKQTGKVTTTHSFIYL